MDLGQSFVLVLRVLALGAVAMASLVSLFSEAENKYERIACLYLSSIAYSGIAFLFQ